MHHCYEMKLGHYVDWELIRSLDRVGDDIITSRTMQYKGN